MTGLTKQKYLKLLRAMTGVQLEEYRRRLARGYVELKITRYKSGRVAVVMAMHDKLLGNFGVVLYPDGKVEGGRNQHPRVWRKF
jgi:hypothetical protein